MKPTAAQVLDTIKFKTTLTVSCSWCDKQQQFVGDNKAGARRAAKVWGWTVPVTKDGEARCPEHRWKRERP